MDRDEEDSIFKLHGLRVQGIGTRKTQFSSYKAKGLRDRDEEDSIFKLRGFRV